MKIRGIYKITNKINGKVYIGESLDIKRRWEEHINELNNNSHHSYKLQNDWNTYGQDNFKFEILLTLDKYIAKFKDKYINVIYEDKYITKYNSIDKGYNIEKTIEKVLNKEKIIQSKNKDLKMLETMKYLVDKEYIIVKDNVVYEKIKPINIIIEKYNKLTRDRIRKIFLENNIIEKVNSRSYIITEYGTNFILGDVGEKYQINKFKINDLNFEKLINKNNKN